MSEVLVYLDDILDAADKIEWFTRGLDYEAFAADPKTVDAVLRNFEVIGAAAKNVPGGVRKEYDDVPWSEMAGMRDKLIHGYATIDLRIVWTTVREETPTLKTQIESLRNELDRRETD